MPTQQANYTEQINDVSGGWIPTSVPITFLSADSPSFLVNVNYNVTGTFGVGMKMQLTHQSSVKNFIITQVTFTGTNTQINLYGGTDFTLNVTGAITNPAYSVVKSPFGFNTAPDKWTVETNDTTLRTQSTPSGSVWYNNGSIQIVAPIGKWMGEYDVPAQAQKDTSSAQIVSIYVTLSTANNTESNKKWTAVAFMVVPATTSQIQSFNTFHRENEIDVSSKTTFFLNEQTDQTNAAAIYFRGDLATIVVRLRCAYL